MNNWNLELKTQYHSQQNKKIKYLGINLMKHEQDLYAANEKILIF